MSYHDIPHGTFDYHGLYDDAIERARDGDILVEVGVMLGASLMYLARKAIDSGKKLTIYGVDNWDRATWDLHYCKDAAQFGGPFSKAVHLMRTHTPEEFEYVNLIRFDSAGAAKLFKHQTVHLVFIDALHTFDAVMRDIAAWRDKVKPGGILAGHDHSISYEGVERACINHFGVGGYEVVKAPPMGQDAWRVRR